MEGLEFSVILVVAAFVLPGAISMYVYGLKVPQQDLLLKDRIIEAVCFGLLDLVLLLPFFYFFGDFLVTAEELKLWQIVIGWLIGLTIIVIAPVFWPFALIWLLRFAERKRWIAIRAKTAWDAFFDNQRIGCWVKIVLADGEVLGGRFDRRSYAGAFPHSGHLYVEELWTIGPDGAFQAPVDGNPGVLLRPEDYKYVLVYA